MQWRELIPKGGVGTGAYPGFNAQERTNKALTTGPFGNTWEADAVSLKVAIGGCRTQVSSTRGNAKWI